MKKIKEWGMIDELMEALPRLDLTVEAAAFIEEQYDLFDPALEAREQITDGQIDYINRLYDQHINGNEDAFSNFKPYRVKQ